MYTARFHPRCPDRRIQIRKGGRRSRQEREPHHPMERLDFDLEQGLGTGLSAVDTGREVGLVVDASDRGGTDLGRGARVGGDRNHEGRVGAGQEIER